MKQFIVWQEMKYSKARLFRHHQVTGGYVWELQGAKVTPASLDKTADEMLKDGIIKHSHNGEYVINDLSCD